MLTGFVIGLVVGIAVVAFIYHVITGDRSSGGCLGLDEEGDE